MAGGYQKPGSPAPVSGPGALSARTDGGPAAKQRIAELPDAQYGEAAEFRTLQQQAPLAKAGPGMSAPAGATAGPALPTPLTDPTGRPDEPVTAGADSGPGITTAGLGLPSSVAPAYSSARDFVRNLTLADPTNPALAALANQLERVY